MTKFKLTISRFGMALLGTGVVIAVAAMGCNSFQTAATGGASDNSLASTGSGGGNGATGSTSTVTALSQASVSAVAQQQMNLGVTLTVPVTIQSENGYAGPVNLSIDSTLLAANDPMSTVTATIVPATVTVTAGGTAQAMVTFTSTSATPDLNTYVEVNATTPSAKAMAQVPIMVNAVFEVDILDAGNLDTTGIENWSIPGATTTNFTTHPKGLKVMFCNKDTVEKSGFYRVHSSATAFLHQGTEGLGLPGTTTPSVADGTNATTLGPCYTVNVVSQTADLKDLYYDHNNENAGKAGRTMVFNAFAAPAPVTKSGNPDASFAFLQTNLFNTSCATCHGANAATLGGGISFATYADVLTQVQAGSALGSPLYVQVAPGGTMPQGNPGTTSAALVKDVMDWINDGAANN